MIVNDDCFKYLSKIEDDSVSLILTDPPYDISKGSSFHRGNDIAMNKKYNSISIDFGYWDKTVDLDVLFFEFYRVLKKGGTLIIFFDIWKSNQLKELADKYKFKQPRIGTWLKNNPVPVNSKVNYLSNASEYFFTFTKDKKPTFNSEYDNGVYQYPLCHGKERLDHPTQKPLSLIKDLIVKHSNEGDLVLDPFSGTGTTAEACIISNREYICIEKDETYYNLSIARINKSFII